MVKMIKNMDCYRNKDELSIPYFFLEEQVTDSSWITMTPMHAVLQETSSRKPY